MRGALTHHGMFPSSPCLVRNGYADAKSRGKRHSICVLLGSLPTCRVLVEAVIIVGQWVVDSIWFNVGVVYQRRIAVGCSPLACACAVRVTAEIGVASFERVVVQFRVDIEFMTLLTGDIAAAIGRIARTECTTGLLNLLWRFLVGIKRAAHGVLLRLSATHCERSQGLFRPRIRQRTVRAPGTVIAMSETPAQLALPASNFYLKRSKLLDDHLQHQPVDELGFSLEPRRSLAARLPAAPSLAASAYLLTEPPLRSERRPRR